VRYVSFFFQAEDGIRDWSVTGVQTCALPISIGAFAFLFSFVLFLILKVTIGIRVTPEEEEQGLDLSEHGAHAYKLD